MATYVNDLRLKEIATGDEAGTWGTSTNTNLELIAEAFSFGTEAITTNADTHTTTIADGSTDPGRSIYLKYTGTLDSACTITIGPNTVSKLWFIENGTSGSQNIIISQGSGANVTIPAGHVKAVYSDGAGSGAAMVDAFTDLNLAGTTTVDDLTVSDDLTVTDDAAVGGDLTVTGTTDLGSTITTGDLTIDVDDTPSLHFKKASAADILASINVSTDAGSGGKFVVQTKRNGDTALDRFVIDDDGKVGINTTSPDNEFHINIENGGEGILVKSTGDHSGMLQFNVNRSNGNRVLGQLNGLWNGTSVADIQLKSGDDTTNKDDGAITFSTSSADNIAEKMRIDGSGNVSIGTTSTNNKLTVSDATNISMSSGAAGQLRIEGNGYSGAIALDANAMHIYQNSSARDIVMGNNETEQLRLDSSGNLFLGTTDGTTVGSPNTNLIIGSTTNNEEVAVTLNNMEGSNNRRGKFFLDDDTGNIGIDCTASSGVPNIVFNTAGTTRLKITSGDGDVIIGGTSVGDVGALTIQPNEDDGAPVLTINRSSTSATSDPIRFKNGGSTVSQIAYNSTEVTYGTGSDARKKNILGEAKGLEIVNKLNPVNFEWKDGGRIQDGLIAQEVKELIPNAVIVNDDGYYSMDYSKLVTPLIKAIQEQQEQIDALQSEINILKGE